MTVILIVIGYLAAGGTVNNRTLRGGIGNSRTGLCVFVRLWCVLVNMFFFFVLFFSSHSRWVRFQPVVVACPLTVLEVVPFLYERRSISLNPSGSRGNPCLRALTIVPLHVVVTSFLTEVSTQS